MELTDIAPYFQTTEISTAAREKVFSLLGSLRAYHQPTFDHSIRVGILAHKLGGMQNHDPKTGIYGALHDIGKLNIHLDVLNKTEGFNEEDRQRMKSHVSEGYKILSSLELPFSAWIALTHHRYQPRFYPENYELSKYPFPIPNATPSTKLLADTWASLVSTGDSYDAATNRKNDRFHGVQLVGQELKNWLITQNPASEYIIRKAYDTGILS
ncbi:HD domain protein [uncultured archaeon]|nr:HD domain protein [uncultured archaeon]